jgi:hypothetical protein
MVTHDRIGGEGMRDNLKYATPVYFILMFVEDTTIENNIHQVITLVKIELPKMQRD